MDTSMRRKPWLFCFRARLLISSYGPSLFPPVLTDCRASVLLFCLFSQSRPVTRSATQPRFYQFPPRRARKFNLQIAVPFQYRVDYQQRGVLMIDCKRHRNDEKTARQLSQFLIPNYLFSPENEEGGSLNEHLDERKKEGHKATTRVPCSKAQE